MSVRVMNLVWAANLQGTRKIVLLRLADHAHDDGSRAYPSIAGLAAACGFGVRTIQDALRDLEKLGVIILVGQGTGGRGHAREYRIDLERVQLLHPMHTEKGAAPAPFPPQKGAALAVKGAAPAVKGAGAAPQPLRTIKNPTDSVAAASFNNFWRTFPSRRPHPSPKKTARLKFDAALKRGVPAADIIRGAVNFAKYVTRERPEPKFITQAVTWLNQERWAEYQVEPEPAKPAAVGWL